MRMYGPELLTNKIATKEDLGKLVICTEALPDPNEMSIGSVMQLTKTQKGYTATHFYMCTQIIPIGKDPYNVWIDLAEFGHPDRLTDDPAYEPHCGYGFNIGVDQVWFTGYLEIDWKQVPDKPEEGVGNLVYEVLVRKPDGYPTHPDDGQVIVRVPRGTEYTSDKPYLFDDEVVIASTEKVRMYYRLFHIFETGWWSMTNGPILEVEP